MKKPVISKKEFIEVMNLIEAQEAKDHGFADFMEKYLDGRFVPMMNEQINMATVKLLEYIFNDREKDKYSGSFIEWWLYENGDRSVEKPAVAMLDDIEYRMTTHEEFYDFMVLWMNKK